jgi:hypothetical protein
MAIAEETVDRPDLLYIDDVEPVSEQDLACIAEIKDVLRKHNRLSRFGISLLHGHFDVADDEVMVETCDVKERTLLSRPIKKSALDGMTMIETNFRLDTGSALMTCVSQCHRTAQGHLWTHRALGEVDD